MQNLNQTNISDEGRRRGLALKNMAFSSEAFAEHTCWPGVSRRVPLVLVVTDRTKLGLEIVASLERFRHESVIAETFREANAFVRDAGHSIETVFVPLRKSTREDLMVLRPPRAVSRHVHCVAFADVEEVPLCSRLLLRCDADSVLWRGRDRGCIDRMLKRTLGLRNRSAHARWSDRKIFDSAVKQVSGALTELALRYEARVHQLSCAAGINAPDREDLVQDVYLEVIRRLPLLVHKQPPAYWMDQTAMDTLRRRAYSLRRPEPRYYRRNHGAFHSVAERWV